MIIEFFPWYVLVGSVYLNWRKKKLFLLQLFLWVLILRFYLMEKRREFFYAASTYWRLWFSTLAFHAYYIENATDMFAFFLMFCSLLLILLNFVWNFPFCFWWLWNMDGAWRGWKYIKLLKFGEFVLRIMA